jgi:hypothetical protein
MDFREFPADETGLRDYFAAHAPEVPEWFMPGVKGATAMMERLAQWRWRYAAHMMQTRST